MAFILAAIILVDATCFLLLLPLFFPHLYWHRLIYLFRITECMNLFLRATSANVDDASIIFWALCVLRLSQAVLACRREMATFVQVVK